MGDSITLAASVCVAHVDRVVFRGKDYSKAYVAYVVCENPWYKFLQCGHEVKILDIITSMYNCVGSKVHSNSQVSDSFDCKLMVRPGECLSPYLFAVYTNNIEMQNAKYGRRGNGKWHKNIPSFISR